MIYVGEACPRQQQHLKKVLSGLEWMLFEDGFALYRAVHEDPPQLLVVNLLLPGLDPQVLVRLLKFDSRFTALPILCLSNQAELGLADRMRRLGARATVTADELLDAVTTLLGH